MSEVWRPVSGFEGCYEVSSEGAIRSIDRTVECRTRSGALIQRRTRGRLLKSWADCNGYRAVYLCAHGQRRAINVHRIVATEFCALREGCNDVNHKDGVKDRNAAANLEWVTRKENMTHALEIGLSDKRKPIMATSVETGVSEIFQSAADAARALGDIKRNGNISSAATGKLKQAYGFRWSYV